jgi:hypothetical protein
MVRVMLTPAAPTAPRLENHYLSDSAMGETRAKYIVDSFRADSKFKQRFLHRR